MGRKMIAAILFDLYETLVTERDSAPARASALGPRLGLDDAAFRERWRPQRQRIIRGQLSLADALLVIGAQLGYAIDPAMACKLCDERQRQKAELFRRFDAAALAAIRQIHDRGVKTAVVSNCFAEDVQGWPTCEASQWVDAAIFSFAVGAAKPEATIYLTGTRRLSVKPSDTLFVGDGW